MDDPRHIFLSAGEVMARYGWGKTKGYQNLKDRELVPPPVMTHPDRWRLDQLLAWEEKRMALAEAALEALLSTRREEVSVSDLLPQPKRRPARHEPTAATRAGVSRRLRLGHDGAVQTGELDRLDKEIRSASRGPAEAYVEVLNRAIAACEADPAATAYFDVLELHSELADTYDRLGMVEDALRHADALAEHGYRSQPDPRCRRAEILTRHGRLDEAAEIWNAVAADTPDDVWVHNNAGLEYGAIGEHELALSWLTRALEIAIRTGDPERLLGQLRDLRAASLAALGLDPDDLQSAAPALTLPARGEGPAGQPGIDDQGGASRKSAVQTPVALAWLPADEYAEWPQRWPDLADSPLLHDDEGEPVSHTVYCRRIEGRLRAHSEAGMARLSVVPVRADEFRPWVAENAPDEPDPSQLRAQYAADVARDPSRTFTWPPGRNDPCWCGSGRKYKKCCGAPGVPL